MPSIFQQLVIIFVTVVVHCCQFVTREVENNGLSLVLLYLVVSTVM